MRFHRRALNVLSARLDRIFRVGVEDMKKAIQDKEGLVEAVLHVATETLRLAKKIVGKTFPTKSLTVFAHSQSEYELLVRILEDMGKPHNYNNGPRLELYEPIKVGDNRITHLRIRKPDSERPQVGCSDFETDYESFKNDYLSNHPDNLRLIKRPEYEMIEFYDPGFDVLAYVVSG
ncbi:MAG: hypothetical protein A3C07_02550 [Candidatus Sungbacteria bacterium RIFCSPHIGHO2_02_FULL_47_11]|uniref:Uncharacterized protein n=1 Tax=Candidatus Sungbacteria bacterium RIFCSPHIGHO2_02_FULL_47_11 TaxID=1802270 RepID=A0A1G2KG97_9BACT|nr:MAG: hypothetical protein A3C07_02550 [Candidatus Sungbacteria bacterium RIFCSPHIGHO2_02_FULL_47_11]